MNDIPMSRLRKLAQLGQSPWYDNMDRLMIKNGQLKALFENGILGVTTNPTIFEKAIKTSTVYDETIVSLKEEGKPLEAIYDELTAADVRDAADMLKEVYERSKGLDGYVSIEVLPAYAHDPFKTMDYARQIFRKVGRPNIMIKVPATKEAPEAIRALIREGISVNATLIFSVAQYEAVAAAYVDALRDRVREGRDAGSVASVASVFVSRIDSKVDHLLDVFADRHHDLEKRKKVAFLKGKIAIANSKMIYQRFKDIFGDRGFGDLKMGGARVQRPLWASTSTKNPLYPDLIYVDNLIGPSTVNTMPHATAEAFLDHGRVALTLESDLLGARAYLTQLSEMDIDLGRLCEEAQVEGVQAFESSFNGMMAALNAKAA
jgi:transaldolase